MPPRVQLGECDRFFLGFMLQLHKIYVLNVELSATNAFGVFIYFVFFRLLDDFFPFFVVFLAGFLNKSPCNFFADAKNPSWQVNFSCSEKSCGCISKSVAWCANCAIEPNQNKLAKKDKKEKKEMEEMRRRTVLWRILWL